MNASTSLRTHLTRYLDHRRSLRASPHTLRTLRYHIESFLRCQGHGTDLDPSTLRIQHLEDWMRHLSDHRTGKGLPLKPSTINRHIESLRVFLRHLAGRGWLPRTLPEALRYIKQPSRLPTSVLNHRQMKRVLGTVATADAQGWRNRAMLELLYSSGMRSAELLGLDIGDIDLVNATAMVTGKGDKQRLVPIGKTALRLLESYIKAVRPFLARQPDQKALFLNDAGARLPYHTFRRILRREAGQAGLEIHVTAHTFRRSCTTELIRGGANLYHVKELLGHENLETLKHYAKLTIEDLKRTHRQCHPREKADER
ncbi:MAG: tyrosine-type recombinase/integrase [Phycisphaerae bacterium]